MFRSSKMRRLIPLFGLAAALAGCASGFEYREPKVTMSDYRHEVAFTPGSSNLSPEAAVQLQEFLVALRASSEAPATPDHVFVVGAASVLGDPNQVARLIDRRNRAVADALAANGIDAEPLPADAAVGQLPPDRVLVLVRRTIVSLPACPNWSAWPNYANFHNQPLSNWSCATAVNFGMMVAEPSDIVRGRAGGPADGELMARSIENYRKGKTKPIMRDVSTAEAYAGGDSGSSSQ